MGRGGFIDSVLAALDGFYGTVVQHVRPWTAKAPQLPRGAKTAVEEAGIDIEPPARDLSETGDDLDLEHSPPLTKHEPTVVVDAVRAGASVVATDDTSSNPVPSPAHDWTAATRNDEVIDADENELVSWQSAHDKLEHERDTDPAAGNPV